MGDGFVACVPSRYVHTFNNYMYIYIFLNIRYRHVPLLQQVILSIQGTNQDADTCGPLVSLCWPIWRNVHAASVIASQGLLWVISFRFTMVHPVFPNFVLFLRLGWPRVQVRFFYWYYVVSFLMGVLVCLGEFSPWMIGGSTLSSFKRTGLC